MKNTNKFDTAKASPDSSVGPVKAQGLVYWKQVLVTTLTVYPLLLAG